MNEEYIEKLERLLNSQVVDNEEEFLKFCEEAKDDTIKALAIKEFIENSVTGNPFDEGLTIDDLNDYVECLYDKEF